jgi:hypothetical protein
MDSPELLMWAQPLVHYSLHLAVPGALAWIFARAQWKRVWLILLATMLVDLDHLLAYPDVFVADRCSIGTHPLHSGWAIAVYGLLTVVPNTKVRIVAVGLLFHMLTDAQDCLWTAWSSGG